MNWQEKQKGVAMRDPPTIDQNGNADIPWLKRPLKERRRIQREIENIRRTEGLPAARLAWFRSGKPLTDEMLKVLERDGSLRCT